MKGGDQKFLYLGLLDGCYTGLSTTIQNEEPTAVQQGKDVDNTKPR